MEASKKVDVGLKPTKPEVHYTQVLSGDVVVGCRASVITTDHPSPLVVNGQPCITSTVVSYDTETGVFETGNTIYKPFKEQDE